MQEQQEQPVEEVCEAEAHQGAEEHLVAEVALAVVTVEAVVDLEVVSVAIEEAGVDQEVDSVVIVVEGVDFQVGDEEDIRFFELFSSFSTSKLCTIYSSSCSETLACGT